MGSEKAQWSGGVRRREGDTRSLISVGWRHTLEASGVLVRLTFTWLGVWHRDATQKLTSTTFLLFFINLQPLKKVIDY